jgi:hypothetical protein
MRDRKYTEGKTMVSDNVRVMYQGGELASYPTLADAVGDTRLCWNEEPEGPQCFELLDAQGWTLAVLLRDQADAEVCHTLYADAPVSTTAAITSWTPRATTTAPRSAR